MSIYISSVVGMQEEVHMSLETLIIFTSFVKPASIQLNNCRYATCCVCLSIMVFHRKLHALLPWHWLAFHLSLELGMTLWSLQFSAANLPHQSQCQNRPFLPDRIFWGNQWNSGIFQAHNFEESLIFSKVCHNSDHPFGLHVKLVSKELYHLGAILQHSARSLIFMKHFFHS